MSFTDREYDRKVTTSEAENFAFEHGIPYMETSALVGTNVVEAFNMLFDRKSLWKYKKPLIS